MKYHSHDEEVLEPIARYLRFKKGLQHIQKKRPITLVDLGCGPKIRFYDFASRNGVQIKKYIGIDPLVSSTNTRQKTGGKVLVKKAPLKNRIPLQNNSVDIVVGFAFLEHIENPEIILNESLRVIRKGGTAIFTTPSESAKSVLEFLSYKIGLISKREIDEHKDYFTKEKLLKMVSGRYKIKSRHEYFEFGMNNLLVLKKLR